MLKFWIDLYTAPDPFFFRPIADRLESMGHQLWTTAREYGQTVPLAQRCGFECVVVGKHGGESTAGKASAIMTRAWKLTRRPPAQAIDAAVSVGSLSQALACRLRGIPFINIMDYEYQPANYGVFRLASRVVVPLGYDEDMLYRQCGNRRKAVFFDGLKEHVTTVGFHPDPSFPDLLGQMGVAPDDVLVTMRPAATSSVYHRFENTLFDEAAVYLAKQPGVKVIVLPRYPTQADYFRSLGLASLIVPSTVLDGLNLVYWSDLIMSGGGSMNREGVVLGTPTYTVFKGKMAGIDNRMIANGTMHQIATVDDLPGVRLAKRSRPVFRPIGDQVLLEILQAIVDVPEAS